MTPEECHKQHIETYPCGFVTNTDPSHQPGTHWVAFYFVSKEEGEFFDSYGYPPNHYKGSFKDFLDKHSYDWNFNDRKLQSNWSDVCGQYCIFYPGHRARGFSMNKIVQLFGNDTALNDAKVSRFVKTYFRVVLKQPIPGFVQCCKKLIQ